MLILVYRRHFYYNEQLFRTAYCLSWRRLDFAKFCGNRQPDMQSCSATIPCQRSLNTMAVKGINLLRSIAPILPCSFSVAPFKSGEIRNDLVSGRAIGSSASQASIEKSFLRGAHTSGERFWHVRNRCPPTIGRLASKLFEGVFP